MPGFILSFNNNYGIYLFVYLMLPLLFFYKTKIINFTTIQNNNDFSLSQNTNNQLKGIFVIIVILHHIAQHMDPYGLLLILHYVGYLAVGAFFFISGFGLTKSIQRNDAYLNGFIYKKMARIYLPFIVINLLTVIVLYVNGTTFTYDMFTKYIIGIKLIDGTLWFIVTILILYFFFYLSFKKDYNLRSLFIVTILTLIYILVCIFFDMSKQTYVSSLCFPVGIYYAFFEEKINSIIYNKFVLILSLFLFFFLVIGILYKTNILPKADINLFISSVFFIIFIVILFLKINPNSFIFNLIGKISLEIYLLHMKVLIIFSFFTKLDSGFWIILYLFTVIISALLFNKFNNLFYSKLATTG